jgi:site-specific DNA recombinase
MISNRKEDRSPPPGVRCAIYTRKSTEEGLEQEFNTLDAQRESGEAYIAAQKHEGWVCLPDRYDDGGYTGGNMDRPALARLLKDIEAGRVDCIVVYKVDRLSRSLMDFARMMSVFDKHKVSFVSVTQQFNTTHSMGRLTLNILLSFAQFEREIISERTRDKMAASRRKGKWAGGRPLLGYDLQTLPGSTKLVVNASEAAQVRAMFEIYLLHGALVPATSDIDARGWRNKAWTTKSGRVFPAKRFDKSSLFALLTNITYIGKVRYKEEVHPGEHEGIVPQDLFERVQATLKRNGRTGGAEVRNKYGALLRGILTCATCQRAMTHAYTAKGDKHYRYYVCAEAQKRGWHVCETKSVPALEMEDYVVKRVKSIGKDQELARAVVRDARRHAQEECERLEAEIAALDRDLKRNHAEIRSLVGKNATALMASLNDRIQSDTTRREQAQAQLDHLRKTMVDEVQAMAALAKFDPVWITMSPREQARLLSLLIESVTYNGKTQSVTITFLPGAMATLGQLQPKEVLV